MFNEFLRTGSISIPFEDRVISSDMLSPVPLEDEINIDRISLLFVAHLDAIYFEMLKAAEGRGQDPHKWINLTFHMIGIWSGFSDIYNDLTFHESFRRYYHPTMNPNVNAGLPQPAALQFTIVPARFLVLTLSLYKESIQIHLVPFVFIFTIQITTVCKLGETLFKQALREMEN